MIVAVLYALDQRRVLSVGRYELFCDRLAPLEKALQDIVEGPFAVWPKGAHGMLDAVAEVLQKEGLQTEIINEIKVPFQHPLDSHGYATVRESAVGHKRYLKRTAVVYLFQEVIGRAYVFIRYLFERGT